MRVFYDRLTDDNDREWLFNEIRSNVNTNFQETFDVVFNNLSDSTVRISKKKKKMYYVRLLVYELML